ncbi:MAG: hypothetical protein M1817_003944 [Caeruleum heppii]|nr:MAG: hypothetical protein M1817_003944 [Caeruleum heppii]
MPLVVLRIHMMESPYSGTSSLMDASDGAGNGFKTLYVVFPDGAPYIYVSFAAPFRVTAGIEGRSLREIVIQALPKALSRPDFRYVMRSTALRAKSLRTMVNLRGMGRGNSAAGGWSIFAEGSFEDSPLDHISSQSGKRKIDIDPDDDKENVSMEDPWRKRRKRIAQGRFGLTGKVGDGRAIESLFVRFQDPYHIRFRSDGSEPEQAVLADETLGTSKPTERRRGRPSQISLLDDSQLSESDGHQSASNLWKPDITIHFQGTDVFAGIRKLVERDVIRGGDMPGWMTGEAGVSIGVVKDGRIASRPGVDV